MARSSTDVCLRSSQGETDAGQIFRDPGSILVFGAESTAVLLRQRQQELGNHLLKYRTHFRQHNFIRELSHWTLDTIKLV